MSQVSIATQAGDNPLTVLHVVGAAGPEASGVARYPMDAATYLPDRYRLELLFVGGSGTMVDECQRRGIPVNAVSWATPLQIAGFYEAWKYLRSRRVDIVHQHYGGRSMTRALRWMTGAPVVAHMCGRVSEEAWASGPRTFDMRHFDAVTAVSDAVAQCVSDGVNPVTVYPPIQVPTPSPIRTERVPLVIGAAGRLVPLKRFDMLLSIFAKIARNVPSVKLKIAGDGPERSSLEKIARELQIDDRVQFLGWVANNREFYRGLDLLVHPSFEESFGMTVAEAMAEGVTAIACDVGGLREVVVHQKTGILVGAEDAAAMEASIRLLLGNRELRHKMGDAARANIAERFAPEMCAQRLVEVYDRVLSLRS